jgi:PAS domain S-box-containing protein
MKMDTGKHSSDWYRSLLVTRNIWLYTLAGALLVIVALISLSWKPGTGFRFDTLVQLHRDHPALFLLEAMPVYIWIILWVAQKNLQKTAISYRRETEEITGILEKNSGYARAVSEGDDPAPFDKMLDTELGRALKLIHLNIRSNRRKEREITWITEGKDMISRVLRIHNEIDTLSYQVLKNMARYIQSVQGAMYLYDEESGRIRNIAHYAYNRRKYTEQEFAIGEGLVGQCAYEMDYIYRTEIPDDYITITSGILGDRKPSSILLVPLITNDQLQGVVEFAFLDPKVPKLTIQFTLELGEIIARTLFNLQVNMKTRMLLEESRKMTAELQQNELVMKRNAAEMKSTQQQLQHANAQLQKKIEEEKLAQDRLHWLLENASEVISIYDKDYQLKYISPSVERILGYRPEEMVMGKDFERIDRKSSNEIRKAFELLLEAPAQTVTLEYSYTRKDGKRIFLASGIRNLLEDPSVNGFIFNTRDITESKLIEKEQRLKSRMQSLSENSLDLILRVSTSGIIYYTNPVVEDYTGIAASGIVNKSLEEVGFNNTITELLKDTLHKVTGKPEKMNREITLPVALGGRSGERILHFNIIPEFQDRELETILFVGHDITEAKRIEKEIKITNRKMQDSINYAERIQSSILPSMHSIRKAIPESFVFYKPRDVISGDFPWFFETKDAYFVAAIDCTGHGVPGALLSFVGFFLLNNITVLNPDKQVGEICDELNREVRRTLKQDRKNPDTRDGMDLALCKIYKNMERVEFTGAHRPMYLLREGEIAVYKGDRRSIGGFIHPRKPEKDFTTIDLRVGKGDKLFIFSDGLTDQLGGPEDLKYSAARVREILLQNPGMTMEQYHDQFRKDFEDWVRGHSQIDDVLLIGLGF